MKQKYSYLGLIIALAMAAATVYVMVHSEKPHYDRSVDLKAAQRTCTRMGLIAFNNRIHNEVTCITWGDM